MGSPPQPAQVRVATLPHFTGLDLPHAATAGAAGLDLVAAINGDITLAEGKRARIPSGLILAIPEGYEGQIRPRSGLAHHHGITVTNAPATIDSDYRGEVQVLLINLGDAPFTISRGMRVAQLLVAPVTAIQFRLIDQREMDATARGKSGFGSSGYHSKGQ